TSFLLSLWLPINKSEINEKILPTYTQYQMAIELPRTDVLKYTRRRNHVGNIFISKSGEYKEEIRSIDTSDILIPIPSSMMINFSYLSIVADAEVKMKEITTIKKIYMDAPVRQYCFATENPEFPPEANIYRKHFGRGRLFVFGLKNPMPSGINYPAKEELSTFLKENPDYDFSKNLATETFIRLKKDSFLIDNEWLTKDKFAEKLKEKLNPEQGFSFFIDGDLNVQEFIWYMDEVQSNKLKNLFLTLDFEEYEFLKMQKKASNTSQVGGQYFTK
ncbi:MAG: biopolymer transport protein ExbD, partial [Saprospiraceae bacterium]